MQEENKLLKEENLMLRSEADRAKAEVKKLERELRVSKSFLEKVTKAVEAKDALGAALTASNAKQRAYTSMLLESCPSIIILIDADGSIALSTTALLTAAGIPNFDYIHNRNYVEVLSKYLAESDMDAFKAAVERAESSGGIVVLDAWIDFAGDGVPKFYSIELRRSGKLDGTAGDVMPGVIVVMVDLTDIMDEKRRAEAANTAKSDFLAAMSHEIRTPMNAILGMSEVLDHSDMTSEQRKYLTDIRKSSNVLLTIINDILDFSKIEAGKMELVNVNYSPRLLLDNLHSMFKVLCRESNLEMRYVISNDLPDTIYGDENRLRQVLTNLLSNAVKYTKKGSIALMAWQEEESVLVFEVKDTGIGIKEEDQEKLFKPFEQLDVRKNRNVVGTGLGLAISYNLCLLMGGGLKLNSLYGKGSTFSVVMPYVKGERSGWEEPGDSYDFIAPSARILVVDDIEINLTVAEALLGAFQIVPDTALSGPEAVALVKNNQYDMVFMDHMMPVMDGIEATQIIRALGGWCEKMPIVALSANAISGMEQVFLSNRMDDFLPKPIEVSVLSHCLKKWLDPEMIEVL
ncbi:MAG: ATP-binding protein [Clostridiales bacterium]|nr:ATP-binding protein [Clostridiales bacterium]